MVNTIVIAGAQHPWELETSSPVSAEYGKIDGFIRDNAVPVLAEPGTPLRYSDNAIVRYGLILPSWLEKIRTVIVAGHPTLHRSVAQLISRSAADVYIFEPEEASWHEEGRNPGKCIASVDEVAFSTLAGNPSEESRSMQLQWLRLWQAADGRAQELLRNIFPSERSERGYYGLQVAGVIWDALKHRSNADGQLDLRLFLGSSTPVRDFDLVIDGQLASENAASVLPGVFTLPTVYTSRGLAGIDGLVATVSGIALAPARRPYMRSETVAVLGDISFLYDVGGLFIGQAEPQPPLTIIVFNDHGGGIFSRLEHGVVAKTRWDYARDVERYFNTPHQVDLSHIAQSYGIDYQRIETMRQLTDILGKPPSPRRRILEVPIDGGGAQALYSAIDDSAREMFAL